MIRKTYIDNHKSRNCECQIEEIYCVYSIMNLYGDQIEKRILYDAFFCYL